MNNETIFVPRISNKPKLVIPRQMGILRNRCSYHDDMNEEEFMDDITMNEQFVDDMAMSGENDMIKINWTMETKLNENNSIPGNIYNSFKQLDDAGHFCSLWSSVPFHFEFFYPSFSLKVLTQF